jgi:Zn finger protein HypA/HybF involved in hydrogenase expression
MHEFSLAQEIAKRLKAEAEREGARRIVAVDIEVGGLVHGSPDNIAFWVKESLREGSGQETTVRAVRAAASMSCRDCGRTSSYEPPDEHDPVALSLLARCPHCGSASVEVEGDASCLIRHLELER